jgi:hypothetical protein
MRVPDGPEPISRAARLTKRELPDWPTQEEVKRLLAAHQVAFKEAHDAYGPLTPVERAAVQAPPGHPE